MLRQFRLLMAELPFCLCFSHGLYQHPPLVVLLVSPVSLLLVQYPPQLYGRDSGPPGVVENMPVLLGHLAKEQVPEGELCVQR